MLSRRNSTMKLSGLELGQVDTTRLGSLRTCPSSNPDNFIATSCYTLSYITVTLQCFLHYRRIVISRSLFETSHVNVVHRLAFQLNFNLITYHHFTYVNALTLVHLSVFEFASIYI